MTSEAPIRWAIVGTGHIARKFASDLRHAKASRLVAVGSRRAERAREFAAAMGGGATGDETAAILSRSDVDAVYVATPNRDHLAAALRSLDAGKPVLIEKPIALTAADVRTIAEKASSKGLLAMEAMWPLFTPGIRKLRGLVEDGSIGRIASFDGTLAYARPHREGDKLFDPESGGALLDLGVYPVALAQHLFGEPDEICGMVSALDGGSVRQAGLTLRFGDILASIRCGFEAEGPNVASITGTGGYLSTRGSMLCPSALGLKRRPKPGPHVPAGERPVAPLAGRERSSILSNLRRLASGYRERPIMTPFEGTGLQYQADHFADCLRRGLSESSINSLSSSESVLRTIETVRPRDPGPSNFDRGR